MLCKKAETQTDYYRPSHMSYQRPYDEKLKRYLLIYIQAQLRTDCLGIIKDTSDKHTEIQILLLPL